ncbi:hypothetical protein [Chondromyces apiculatus]|uniref:Uncharacterized protein n=1 Tax=Chondromyces apiculatus DSM 436 TaxID=1192034 RepID=A0A017SVA5_9BACT|nr:hypothetical protein [Chondromyces apiculatus]EYF00231.1 Hypothetical protein CAP_1045 [Chondromyces apiculatus DSM 436]
MTSAPVFEAPSPAALEHTLAAADTAFLLGADARRVRVAGPDLAALRGVLRVREGRPAGGWAPEARVSIALTRGGQPLSRVEIHGDATVRLPSWEDAAPAAAPDALAAWLTAHGETALSRALSRAQAPSLAAALTAFLAAAPAEIRGFAAALAEDSGAARQLPEALAAVRATRGNLAAAAWAFAAWYGARPGLWEDAYTFEAIPRAALRSLDVHEIIRAAAEGIPEGSRAGVARFLVEEVTSRGWALDRRIPPAVREALVEAAHASAPENGARAERLLRDEGPLAPAGSTLVAASASGELRRLCTDGVRAFAVDGWDLVRMEPGTGATRITKLFKPDTPLAVRKGELRFLQPNHVERVPVDGDEVHRGRAPLFDLPARRLPGMLDAFTRRRDEALRRAAPDSTDLVPLDPDPSASAAYAALGGETPAALRLGAAYAFDPMRRVLVEAPWKGPAREVPLGGSPVWMGATETGVLVAVARDTTTALVALDEGGPLRTLGTLHTAATAVCEALLVGGRVWVRLAAPLGDVLVAADPSP